MNEASIKAVDSLIATFEKDTYTPKHVESLLNYLLDLDSADDYQTIAAITKVLGFCTKDFVKVPMIDALSNKSISHEIKAALLTACWESGIDYSAHTSIFVDPLLNGNELVAIEAYTLITELTNYHESMKEAIETITKTNQENYSPAHRVLINDSLHHLISLYQHKS